MSLSSPKLLRRKITGFVPDIRNRLFIIRINLKSIHLVGILNSSYNIVI